MSDQWQALLLQFKIWIESTEMSESERKLHDDLLEKFREGSGKAELEFVDEDFACKQYRIKCN